MKTAKSEKGTFRRRAGPKGKEVQSCSYSLSTRAQDADHAAALSACDRSEVIHHDFDHRTGLMLTDIEHSPPELAAAEPADIRRTEGLWSDDTDAPPAPARIRRSASVKSTDRPTL